MLAERHSLLPCRGCACNHKGTICYFESGSCPPWPLQMGRGTRMALVTNTSRWDVAQVYICKVMALGYTDVAFPYFPSNSKLAMAIPTCHLAVTSQDIWPHLPPRLRKSVLASAQYSFPSSLGHYVVLPHLLVTLVWKYPSSHLLIHTTVLRAKEVLLPPIYKWGRSPDISQNQMAISRA